MPKPADQREPVLRVVSRMDDPGALGGSLEEIYRRYAPYVAAVVLRLLGRGHEVDDLVQDVFVEAARGLDRLRNAEAIKGWLATIAVRLCRRRLQARRLRALLGLDAGYDYATVADAAASPVDRLLLARVYAVLDEVPVEARLAFALHHLEGERLEAVARLCRCSLATAKRRIALAQGRIREVFGDD